MTRLAAASLFLCAAFAWVPPGIDRAGLGLLGLAFLALSIGRGFERRRAVAPSLGSLGALLEDRGSIDLDEPGVELAERIGAYR